MIEEVIRKHALKNALEHGKADPKAVAGKLVAEAPEAKKDMKAAMKSIARIVAEVNVLTKEEIEGRISKYVFPEKKQEERGLELEGAENGKVVTRFPPEPSGYPHIGHAKAAYLDWSCARKYGGTFILRFDDTNPEAESEEYADAIKRALEWLGIDWDREEYSSDMLKELYSYAEKIISSGHAYVCTCKPEEIRLNRSNSKACGCRQDGKREQLERWRGMLDGRIEKGSAVVRFSGNMESDNTAMRDPTLLRIIESEHYRQGRKFRVWPAYDFAAPILDSIGGVTHAMRTKEYELRDELYNAVLDSLGLRKPRIVEFSRLSVKGFPVSKRLLKPLIDEGLVSGWDDPRLPTISALKRRGITREAIKRFVLGFGLGKTESNPTAEALLVENRKILDPVSERYFFVAGPVKLSVNGAPPMKARLKKHPGAKLGVREIETAGEFYISKRDADSLEKGSGFRLKDLCNVKVSGKGEKMTAEFVGTDVGPGPKVQWVPAGDFIEAKVLVPGELVDEKGKFVEGSLKEEGGYCEKTCSDIKQGQVVQFERYGFCKLDDKKSMTFIYTNP